MDFLEAIVTLLPIDAGGRASAIRPRDGSYRPFAVGQDGARIRIRIIEGPPAIQPGHEARVVAEIESASAPVDRGNELTLVEHDRTVGILTITRRFASSYAASA